MRLKFYIKVYEFSLARVRFSSGGKFRNLYKVVFDNNIIDLAKISPFGKKYLGILYNAMVNKLRDSKFS